MIVDNLLQEESICKHTCAKKETVNIVNNMQQYREQKSNFERRHMSY